MSASSATGRPTWSVGASGSRARRAWRQVTAASPTLATARAAEASSSTADLPDTTVAALGLSAVAAWEVLEGRAALQPGEQVLVLGAGGVVGQVAVQAARLLGAAPRRRGRPLGPGAGAGRGLRRGCRRRPSCRRGCRGRSPSGCARRARPVDVVVDPLAGVPGTAAALALAEGGRLVNLGSSAGPALVVDSATLRSRSASVLGYTEQRPHRRAAPGGVRDGPRPVRRRRLGDARRRGARRGAQGLGRGRGGTSPPPHGGQPLTGNSAAGTGRRGGRSTGGARPRGSELLAAQPQRRRVGLAGLRHRDGHRVGARRRPRVSARTSTRRRRGRPCR